MTSRPKVTHLQWWALRLWSGGNISDPSGSPSAISQMQLLMLGTIQKMKTLTFTLRVRCRRRKIKVHMQPRLTGTEVAFLVSWSWFFLVFSFPVYWLFLLVYLHLQHLLNTIHRCCEKSLCSWYSLLDTIEHAWHSSVSNKFEQGSLEVKANSRSAEQEREIEVDIEERHRRALSIF